jgi:hypothetical protein
MSLRTLTMAMVLAGPVGAGLGGGEGELGGDGEFKRAVRSDSWFK